MWSITIGLDHIRELDSAYLIGAIVICRLVSVAALSSQMQFWEGCIMTIDGWPDSLICLQMGQVDTVKKSSYLELNLSIRLIIGIVRRLFCNHSPSDVD